jgi:hypothetical protein
MTYTPDNWVVVTVQTDTETIDKVFAGWVGGFADNSRWKLSSGIVLVDESSEYYDFHNHSGSVYRCYKDRRHISRYMHSVYDSFVNEAYQSNITVTINDNF